MKKLVALIGAVAMGFGLFADDPVSFSTSFEAGEPGVAGATFTPGDGWTWEGNPLALGAYADDAYTYGTGDYARRFDGAQTQYLQLETGDKALARDLGAGNTTVDQLVQFTGYDAPLTEFAADAKIAVWMLGTENTDDTPGETNLYVTCGAEKDALKLVAPAGTAWQTEKWYRLTVKSLGADTTGREQFNIYIDGQLLSSVGQDTQTVFPSMAENELVTKMKIQGIGAIDDVTIDAEGPLFTQTVEFTVELPANVASATVTGAEQTATGWKATNGAAIAITYTAAEGYLFNNKQSTITVDATAAKGTIAATDDVKSATEAKAKIGTTIYLTLQEAFDAAVDGDTVTLVADVADAQALLGNAVAITLDLNGKTICCATPKDANNWYGYTIRVNAGQLTIVDTVGGGAVVNNNDDSAVRCCAPTGGEAVCPKVIIKSGSFVNNSAESGTIYVGPTSGAVIEIEGGTFQNQATFVYPNASGVINVGNDMANKETAIVVTGGTFSLDPALGDDNVAVSYVAQGYVSTEADGWWTVAGIPAADFAKVTVGEKVTYYNDLAAALEAGKAVGSLVELTNDVDLAGIEWVPVKLFRGTFDGKGYKISNLTIAAESGDGIGLICGQDTAQETAGAMIRNVTFENVSIDAPNSTYVGTVGGANQFSGMISNVTVCGTIQIVGFKYVGGICGHSKYGDIVDCHVDGGDNTESFIGQAAEKTAEGQVGGICGMTAEGNKVYRICNCSVKNVAMFGNERVGGIAGRIYGTQVIGCSAENLVLKGPQGADGTGGLIGVSKDNGVMFIINSTTSNIELYDLKGDPVEYTEIGSKERTIIGTDVEAECLNFAPKKRFSFTAGTFTPYGKATASDIVDELADGYQVIDNGDGTYTVKIIPVAKLNGVEFDGTLHEVLEAGAAAGSLVELIKDVNLAGKDWVPVANFAGTFDGKGYKISNLKVVKDDNYAGLLASMANKSVVKNLTVESVDVTGAQYVGAVSGMNGTGSILSNVTVRGSVKVAGAKYVGGVFGQGGPDVVDCHVIGDGVATSFIGSSAAAQAGGIVGYLPVNYGCEIWDCSVANITVFGKEHIGGIAARHQGDIPMIRCSVDGVVVKSDSATTGAIVGQPYAHATYYPNWQLNCVATDTVLQMADGSSRDFAMNGKPEGTLDVIISSNATAENLVYGAAKWNLTGGTYEITTDRTLEKLESQVADGCSAIRRSEGVYEIKKVWDVTLMNGEVAVDTQIVIDGACATNVTLEVEGFKGWTNETYTTGFDFATPIAADLTLYAWIEAAAPWSDVEKGEIEGVTEENKAAVEAQLDAIKVALGEGADEAAVGGWLTKVYGNQKVPAADVVAAKNIAISVKYDLPLMANDPEIEVAKDEAVADGFTFTIKDGEKDVSVAVARVEEIVKYSDTVDGTFAKNTEKIAVTPADTVIKANFRKPNNEAQGFMKAELK